MAKLLRFLAWTLLIVGVLVGVLRLTVIRWWQVPTGDPYLEASLAPTLRGGDWIILWRGTAPREGDLVLCPEPKAAYRQVIGRIVAEANDHIKIDGDRLELNRSTFETESACNKFSVRDPASGKEVEQGCRGETIAGKTHWRGEPNAALAKPAAVDTDVSGQQVFLVSDNRQFPWDSREFGSVQRDTCTETIVFRLVSKEGFFDIANRLTLIR